MRRHSKISPWGRFTAVALASVLAAAIAAAAQQPPLPIVGYLHPLSPAELEKQIAAFRGGLAESGYTEGRNVAIEYRWANGHYGQLPKLAADLVDLQVAVIAAPTLPSALAAKRATATIPLVIMIGDDPVRHWLAASLGHPGGNATGFSMLSAPLSAKRLGLLRDLVPKASLIAVLVNPSNPNVGSEAEEMAEAAHEVGQRIEVLKAATEQEIEAVFASVAGRGVGALVVGADPFFNALRRQIVTFAARYAVPAIYEWREFVEAGGLASYGTQLNDLHRQVGVYTGKILDGAKPADLPVQQPTRFELVINLKTANALGLTLPPSILARADEVIE